MHKTRNNIGTGPFKEKRIELAPTIRVKQLQEISKEFIYRVFDLEPGQYLISDESSVFDFIGMGEPEARALRKIKKYYGINISEIKNGLLTEIFSRIQKLDTNTDD